MIVGYMRVSSVDQNLDRQLDGVELDRVYKEKVSGTSKTGRELELCLESLCIGDELNVQSMHRIATNNKELLLFLELVVLKGASVYFLDEDLLIKKNSCLSLFESLKKFESKALIERQSIGREKARSNGKQIGRPGMTEDKKAEIKLRRSKGEFIRDIAKSMNIGVITIRKYS